MGAVEAAGVEEGAVEVVGVAGAGADALLGGAVVLSDGGAADGIGEASVGGGGSVGLGGGEGGGEDLSLLRRKYEDYAEH